ncbi:MAG TPA: 50S ribosomal protein L25 [Candidatus Moranbacteria bacterium]|nr:50S ribosomal protein L25 [Candidatus Moranbacteria bacterium]
MSQEINLRAERRDSFGKKTRRTGEGKIPAVLYGHNIENQNLWVGAIEFEKVFTAAGESTIVNLVLGEKTFPVIIKDVQRHPVSHRLIHADFYRVKMDEEITTEVPLVFSSEAPAVKELGGTFIHSLDSISIKCLPKDLPHEIKVDIFSLKTFDDSITVKDLPQLSGVEYLIADDVVVASVAAPRVEKEEPVAEEGAESEPTAAEGEEKPTAEGNEK